MSRSLEDKFLPHSKLEMFCWDMLYMSASWG